VTAHAAGGAGLREVRGPSAFGGGAKRLLYLTWIIGLTEYRLTYFGSALGYLWSLMRPLMLFGVLYVVFAEIVDFGGDIVNYPVLLLLNIVLFNFFQDSTTKAVSSLVDREAMVRKMQFPGMVIPLARVLTGVLNLAVSLVAVFVFMLAYGVQPRWSWLLLPVSVVALVALTLATAMILSAVYVRFRDVAPIWAVVSTVLFYGSPVLYAVDAVPEDYRRPLLLVNPIADILEQSRKWIVDPGAPGAVEVVGGPGWALIPLLVSVGICALAVYVLNREAPRIAERL
jgi:ABC-2 type transport system permease protein